MNEFCSNTLFTEQYLNSLDACEISDEEIEMKKEIKLAELLSYSESENPFCPIIDDFIFIEHDRVRKKLYQEVKALLFVADGRVCCRPYINCFYSYMMNELANYIDSYLEREILGII